MKLKETEHAYYCSNVNYFKIEVGGSHETWNDFINDFAFSGEEDDYNHCFRFDIYEEKDDKFEKGIGKFSLYLYFILQRKGFFMPIEIKSITQDDMENIEEWLKRRFEYLKMQWEEVTHG